MWKQPLPVLTCVFQITQPNSEVPDKAAATLRLPGDICRMFPEPCVAKGSIKGNFRETKCFVHLSGVKQVEKSRVK